MEEKRKKKKKERKERKRAPFLALFFSPLLTFFRAKFERMSSFIKKEKKKRAMRTITRTNPFHFLVIRPTIISRHGKQKRE